MLTAILSYKEKISISRLHNYDYVCFLPHAWIVFIEKSENCFVFPLVVILELTDSSLTHVQVFTFKKTVLFTGNA